MSVRVGAMPTGIAWGSYCKTTPEAFWAAKRAFAAYRESFGSEGGAT